MHESLLDPLERRPHGRRRLQRLRPAFHGVRESPLRKRECRSCTEVGAAVLQVGRPDDVREERGHLPRPLELASLQVDLEAARQQAEYDAARVDHLLRELLRRGDGLVPPTEHGKRVRPLGENRPLVRPSALLPGQGEGLVQVLERVRIAVDAEAAVGEDEVADTGIVEQVVFE